jgi:SH3-like domain-containing protein
MRMKSSGRVLGIAVALVSAFAAAAHAVDFKQITENGTVLFDSPSSKSTKLFLLGSGTPVEVIVTVAGWVKVRDASGTLGWVEPRQVGNRSQVQVKVPFATVRAQPNDTAAIVFSAEKDVLLNLAEPTPSSGWVRVTHRDGSAGYVRIESIFGV